MGAGPYTSKGINSRGLEAGKSEVLKGSWCIFSFKQCLQWVTVSLLFKVQDTSMEDSA